MKLLRNSTAVKRSLINLTETTGNLHIIELRNMDSSQSFSHSSQHYSTLLGTVAELRADLERTMGKMKSLEDQNSHLTVNYQAIKEELIATRQKYSEVKDSYMQTATEKIEEARQHEAFIDRIKAELDEKTREFEAIRHKLIPQDIDQLRIKVQEELQIQHKQEIKGMEEELEKQRTIYFAAKRDFDRKKAEFEITQQNQHRELEALRTEREEVEKDLRDQLVKSKEMPLIQITGEELIQSYKAKITELNHLSELSKEECRKISYEKEELKLSIEQKRVLAEETLLQLKSRITLIEADKAGLEERLSRYTSEAESKDSQIRSLKSALDDANNKLSDSIKTQHEAEKSLSSAKEEYNKDIEFLRNTFEAEKTALVEALEQATTRLTEREEIVRQSQRETSEMQIRAQSVEGELRRAHHTQLQEARKKYASVENDLADTKTTLKAVESQLVENDKHFKFEIDSLKSEVSRYKREKDVLHAKLRELETILDSEKRKSSAVKYESESKSSSHETRLREAKTMIASLESKLALALEREMETQAALRILKDKQTLNEYKLVEQAEHINALKREFKTQIEDEIAPAYKEKIEALKKKLKMELAREKKRAEAYKSKAIEAHNRGKSLSEIVRDPNLDF